MTVKEIENQVRKLPRARLKTFRNWFHRFDSDAWDRQIKKDIRSGALAELAQEALSAHKKGKTKNI